MKSIKATLMACCLACFALGCATGVQYSNYHATVAAITAGDGRIWFYRPSAGAPAVQPGVDLDGQTVGRAKPHGYFYVDTTSGAHEVSCTTEWKNSTTVTVAAGQDSYIHLGMMFGIFVGHVIPKEVPASQALDEMKDLHLIDNN